MALKKAEFNDDEVPIFEEALVYKRGEYWQMRMWLAKEHGNRPLEPRALEVEFFPMEEVLHEKVKIH